MFESVKIAPSLLSADFMNLERDVARLEQAGAGFLHVDVMDGHFVPNLTMGVPIIKQLKKITSVPLDVHLMISNPLEQLPWYLEAGSDMVTVHAETLYGNDLAKALALIREGGAQAAVSVKPQTPVEVIEPVLELLDMVLIMSVEPGFSGQSYIKGSHNKVARVVELARAASTSPLIEVDGGMSLTTAAAVVSAGADVLVCGNAVCGAADPASALAEIRDFANGIRLDTLQG